MHLFYTPDIIGDTYTLNEEESKHCIKVLRLSTGNEVRLIDGQGGFYVAGIVNTNPKATKVKILQVQKEYGKRNHRLHIAIAPTKNIDRFEWFVEKATEIGIDEITPIICARSERKEVKVERLNKVITSAVKQSIKAYYPKLNNAKNFSDAIKTVNCNQRFMAHCNTGNKVEMSERLVKGKSYLVLIGPEGDFTENEINQGLSSGFIPVTLGESRLRTETAALEACFEINFLNR